MGRAISVLVKYDGVEFGVYPTISAAAKAVEDYFELKLKVKRPSLYHGFGRIAKEEWTPKENSQLFKWDVEKQ